MTGLAKGTRVRTLVARDHAGEFNHALRRFEHIAVPAGSSGKVARCAGDRFVIFTDTRLLVDGYTAADLEVIELSG